MLKPQSFLKSRAMVMVKWKMKTLPYWRPTTVMKSHTSVHPRSELTWAKGWLLIAMALIKTTRINRKATLYQRETKERLRDRHGVVAHLAHSHEILILFG